MTLRQGVVLAALVASSGAAWAAPGVTDAHLRSPLRVGASSVDLAWEATADTVRLRVELVGAGPTPALASIRGRSLERSGTSPAFLARLPFNAPLPANGQLTLTATPLDAQGSAGTPFAITLDAAAPPAQLSPAEPTARIGDGTLLIGFEYAGQAAFAHLDVTAVSTLALRRVGGNLRQADGAAFASARALRRPLSATGGVHTVVVPVALRAGATVAPDSVVVVDVALTDLMAG